MSSSGIDTKDLQSLLDELRRKHDVVGCTLGVLADGAIRTVGSGVLNLATGVECTPDSVFQIGSIGKIYTTTLIMQLVDEGRLSLDDTVVKHLPDFMIADPAAAREITVRQLLNHTSGMDGDFFPADDPEGPSTVSYVRKMYLLPNLYPPGKGPMTYCNSGFVTAGRIIEVLTGKTWQTVVMERICRPLGMPAAFAHPHEALRYRCAMGHIADQNDPKKVVVAPATFLPVSAAAAGAVLTMSAESLLMFAKAHLADGAYGDGKQLLSARSARAMREPTVAVLPFSRRGVTDWGLGWLLNDGSDYKMAGHDGGTIGHLTYLRTFPEKNAAFTLLTNSPSAKLYEDVEKHMMQALVGHTVAEDPPAQSFTPDAKRMVGEYANIAALYSVTEKNGQFRLKYKSKSLSAPGMDVVLEPYRPDVFRTRSDNPVHDGQKILFLEDDGGRARFIRMGGRMGRRLPG